MGRLCDNTKAQYLEDSASPIVAMPWSASLWFRHKDHTTDDERTLIYLGEHANQNNHATVRLERFSNPAIEFEAGWAAETDVSTEQVNDTAWHHMVYTEHRVVTTNNHNLYLDGVLVANASNAEDSLHSSWDRLTVGRRPSAWNDNYADDIEFAELCILNVRLTAAQIEDIFRAKLGYLGGHGGVLPGNVVAYYPLWGQHSPEVDLSSLGRSLTITGATKCRHSSTRGFWDALPAASMPYVPAFNVPASVRNTRPRRIA